MLNGFLQPTRQIQTLPLADLKVELPLIKNLVLVVPFQCDWHAREAMYQVCERAGDRRRKPSASLYYRITSGPQYALAVFSDLEG